MPLPLTPKPPIPPPALFTNELLRQEQAKLNEARKISVVNVNPTNIRPHSDTPEIRKYKKRFNSEILCAALWGESCFLLPLSCSLVKGRVLCSIGNSMKLHETANVTTRSNNPGAFTKRIHQLSLQVNYSF